MLPEILFDQNRVVKLDVLKMLKYVLFFSLFLFFVVTEGKFIIRYFIVVDTKKNVVKH